MKEPQKKTPNDTPVTAPSEATPKLLEKTATVRVPTNFGTIVGTQKDVEATLARYKKSGIRQVSA
jgi:hypothetical protein